MVLASQTTSNFCKSLTKCMYITQTTMFSKVQLNYAQIILKTCYYAHKLCNHARYNIPNIQNNF